MLVYNPPVLAVSGKKKFVPAPHIEWNPDAAELSVDLSSISSFPVALAFPISLVPIQHDAKHKVCVELHMMQLQLTTVIKFFGFGIKFGGKHDGEEESSEDEEEEAETKGGFKIGLPFGKVCALYWYGNIFIYTPIEGRQR